MAERPVTLRGLFPRVSPSKFLEEHWAKRHVAAHGPLARLGSLGADANLQSVETLLRIPPATIHAMQRTGDHAERAVAVEPKQALEFHRYGNYSLAMEIGDHKTIGASLRALLQELGTPVLNHGCMAFATPAGGETPFRWDDQELFVIQTSGSAVWNLAENRSIPRPTGPYHGPDDVHSEVKALAPAGGIRPPTRSTRITLKPGSVLHLPRGTWHRMRTNEGSVALALSFGASTWVDWFPNHVRSGLVPDLAFRHPAVGFTARGPARAAAQAELARLLPVFRERVRAWGNDLLVGDRKPKRRASARRRAVARAAR